MWSGKRPFLHFLDCVQKLCMGYPDTALAWLWGVIGCTEALVDMEDVCRVLVLMSGGSATACM